MASSIGSLIVRLGLDAAEFQAGLSKSEYAAQRFAQQTRSAIASVATALGGLALGTEFLNQTKEIISQAASLNDLSDATGSTVENLSRLSNQAQIAGTDFATMQAAVLKLSAGMAGADDESTKVKEALKLLGVSTRDPVEALQQVAIKLNTYADGVNKVGLAVALFGKQGPAFLATLKDIAELQDVGATVSKKQAEEAEALGKAFRRLGVEATGFRNALLSDVVPALNAMISEMKTGIEVAGGFFNAFRLFGTLDLGKVSSEIRDVEQDLVRLNAVKNEGGLLAGLSSGVIDAQIERAQKRLQFLRIIQTQQQAALSGPGDPGGVSAGRKPEAPFISGAKDAKALKERTSEAERYLETLAKQLQGTLDLNAEETILVELYKLQQDAQSGLTASGEDLIRDYARQIQGAADLKKATEEQKRAEEDAARIRTRISQETERSIEKERQAAQALRDQNEALRENLVFLQGGEVALKAYTDAKLAKAIAELQDKEAMLQNVGASQAEIEAIREQIKALKERQQIFAQTDIAEQLKKEKQVLDDFKNAVSDSFANTFEGFIKGTKSAKDAFKSFVDEIESMLIKLALKKLMNQILGVDQQGPDIFSVFAKLLGSFGGAGAGGAATVGAGLGYELGSLAGGTSNWRGGLTMVGENGPELAWLPRGTAVNSSADTRDMMGGVSIGNMSFHIDGQVNSASIRQIRNAARDGVMAAARDR